MWIDLYDSPRDLPHSVSIRRFLTVLSIWILFYDVWGVCSDIPSNYNRYVDERDAGGTTWLSFEEGLRDVTDECVLDRSWETWSGYLLWMTAYFSLGVWSSLGLCLFDRGVVNTVSREKGGIGSPLLG